MPTIWKATFSILGFEEREELPAISRCPVCRQPALHSYQDTLSPDAWHYCLGCGFRGGSVALAAAAWGCAKPAAAERLARLAPDLPILQHWDEQGPAENRGEDLQELLDQERVERTDRHALWDLAEIDRRTVEPFCARYPGCALVLPKMAALRFVPEFSQYRHLRKKDVRLGAFAVSYMDLPGRVTALWITSEPARRQKHFYASVGVSRLSGTGFGFLDTVPRSNDPDFHNWVFLLDDAESALDAHVRHLDTELSVLPIVSFDYNARLPSPASFSVFRNRRVVVWGRKLTPEIIRYARLAGGEVAIDPDGGSARGPGEPGCGVAPKAWLHRLIETRTSWQKSLEVLVPETPPSARAALLASLGLSTREWTELLASASPENRTTFRLHLDSAVQAVTVGDCEVREEGGTWKATLRSGAVTISDAIFRIHRVYSFPKDIVYCGEATYQGTVLPFAARAAEIVPDALAYLRALFLKRSVGLVDYAPEWASRAFRIAVGFSRPELTSCSAKVGWQNAASLWMFANYSIGERGNLGPGLPTPLPPKLVPTTKLGYRFLKMDDIRRLSAPSEVNACVWAALQHVVTSLLAPWTGQERKNLAVVGRGAFSRFARCVSWMGSDHLRIDERRADALTILDGASDGHDWVLPVVRTRKAGCRLGLWQRRPASDGLIAGFSKLEASLLLLGNNWEALRFKDPETQYAPDQSYKSILPALVPGFLRWMTQRRFGTAEKIEASQIGPRLVEWFDSLGGKIDWLARFGGARRVVPGKVSRDRILGAVFNAAGFAGEMRSDFGRRCYWVKASSFFEAIEKRDVTAVSEGMIRKAIQKSGGWMEMSTDEAWAFRAAWWEQRVKKEKPLETVL